MYEGAVQDLIDELGRLPGVGPKSAQRIAFHLLAADPADVRRLVHALTEVKDKVRFCRDLRQRQRAGRVPRLPRPAPRPVGHLRGRGAQGRRRDRAHARVPRALPRARRRDQPDRGRRPRRPAGARADGAAAGRRRSTELILATDPNLEGEATATYLARLFGPMGLRITRLASGLPVGGDLEYADEVTLGRAFEGRRQVDV